MTNKLTRAGLLGALTFILAACGPKQVPLEPLEAQPPVEEAAPPPVVVPTLDIGTEYGAVSDMESAYFDYNKADLRMDARESLKKNAALLKAILGANPDVAVRVEGHCDERGTLEYNMALGQRRANAVANYYKSLGIPRAALSAVSYGEERPICVDPTEDCWARNRRGVTTLKADAPLSIPLDTLPR